MVTNAAATHNQSFGRFGEDTAASWYQSAGYQLLERNWRCPEGELDLIVARDSTVAFVEVKSRTSSKFGAAAEAVDRRKRNKIRTTALRWLATFDGGFDEIRFDVVAVDRKGHVEPIFGCF